MMSESLQLPSRVMESFCLLSVCPANKQTGNTNIVFSCVRKTKGIDVEEVFVRITNKIHRSRDEVEAEITFQASLFSAGISVSFFDCICCQS